jgi:hypothetical protein
MTAIFLPAPERAGRKLPADCSIAFSPPEQIRDCTEEVRFYVGLF